MRHLVGLSGVSPWLGAVLAVCVLVGGVQASGRPPGHVIRCGQAIEKVWWTVFETASRRDGVSWPEQGVLLREHGGALSLPDMIESNRVLREALSEEFGPGSAEAAGLCPAEAPKGRGRGAYLLLPGDLAFCTRHGNRRTWSRNQSLVDLAGEPIRQTSWTGSQRPMARWEFRDASPREQLSLLGVRNPEALRMAWEIPADPLGLPFNAQQHRNLLGIAVCLGIFLLGTLRRGTLRTLLLGGGGTLVLLVLLPNFHTARRGGAAIAWFETMTWVLGLALVAWEILVRSTADSGDGRGE